VKTSSGPAHQNQRSPTRITKVQHLRPRARISSSSAQLASLWPSFTEELSQFALCPRAQLAKTLSPKEHHFSHHEAASSSAQLVLCLAGPSEDTYLGPTQGPLRPNIIFSTTHGNLSPVCLSQQPCSIRPNSWGITLVRVKTSLGPAHQNHRSSTYTAQSTNFLFFGPARISLTQLHRRAQPVHFVSSCPTSEDPFVPKEHHFGDHEATSF
jgi:hypothetical protein